MNHVQTSIEFFLLSKGTTRSKREVIWGVAWSALQPWPWILLVLMFFIIQGCASVPPHSLVPEQYSTTANIPGIPKARIWGDAPPPWLEQTLRQPEDKLRSELPALFGHPHYYLAISGGGANGAFTAGLLNGWSATGNRPEFSVVTGISTGSLLAPFAFLGPRYDHILTKLYTSYSTEDLIDKRRWFELLTSDSLADTTKFRATIAEYMTEEVMQEIVAEHRKGRRLFIGTVNLNAARPVMWNIGEIANSGQPGALDLIRKIMLASSSIPGAFPPVFIEVEAGGERYDEMHVDGGMATQVFLYPLGANWREVLKKLQVTGTPRVYVIRNAKIAPEWEPVELRIMPIVSRSIASLIRTQGIGDMFRMYVGATRDKLDYNLAYIPDDFEIESKEAFDPQYMRALYDRAYEMAKTGYDWKKTPPGM
jgi:predicted acylesterase/phospholipase RssA